MNWFGLKIKIQNQLFYPTVGYVIHSISILIYHFSLDILQEHGMENSKLE